MKLGRAGLVQLFLIEEKRLMRSIDFLPAAILNRIEETLNIIRHLNSKMFGNGMDEFPANSAELDNLVGDDSLLGLRIIELWTLARRNLWRWTERVSRGRAA